jgi:hypothetical protein
MMRRRPLQDGSKNADPIGMSQARQQSGHVTGIRGAEERRLGPLPRRGIEPPYPGESEFGLRTLALQDSQMNSQAEPPFCPGGFWKKGFGGVRILAIFFRSGTFLGFSTE